MKISGRQLFLLTFSLIFILLGAGCSFEQDPLDKYPKNIQEGLPPNEKPGDSRPLNPPIIDVNESYTVQEDSTIKFIISARVFQPDIKWTINIENLSEFKGATFDSASGEFIWTPEPGVVVGPHPVNKRLDIALALETSPIYAIYKSINLFILRKAEAPVIETVTDFARDQIIYEGQNHSFQVSVRTRRANEKPQLIATPTVTGKANAASLIGFNNMEPIQNPQDPHLWVFSMRVQTDSVDLTNSKQYMSFGLQAISPFGEVSAVTEQDIVLYTSLSKPKTTWRSDLKFVAGQKNIYDFSVYDPREEGVLKITDNCQAALDLSAKCSCLGAGSVKNCTIEWAPSLSKINLSFAVEINAKNLSPNSNDYRNSEMVFRNKINVVAPPEAGKE